MLRIQYALHEVVEKNFHFVLKNSLLSIVSKTFDDFSPLVFYNLC